MLETYMSLNILFSSRWGKFWPKRFKIGLFLKQKYEIFRGFFEILRKCFGIFRHFFENFRKDVQAILCDICVQAQPQVYQFYHNCHVFALFIDAQRRYLTLPYIVCYTAVLSVVTQCSSSQWGGALRDDSKNGCVADYTLRGWATVTRTSKEQWLY